MDDSLDGDEERDQTPVDVFWRTMKALGVQTRITRRYAVCSLVATIVNLGYLAYAVPTGIYGDLFFFRLAVVASALSLLVIGLHELARKRGDGYFQELSDQLHQIAEEPFARVLVVRARTAARSFSSAADLAFFRGRFGTPAYAALNLGVLAAWVVLAAGGAGAAGLG